MSLTRPLKIFLCHASVDKPAVRKLSRYLRSKGMDPWLDVEKLLPGESWEVEIPKALFNSDVILVCLSKNSVDKEGYVQKEITFALDKAKEKLDVAIFIIPAKLEDCIIPMRLSSYQWVDLYRDDGRRLLMLSLNKRVEQLGLYVEQLIISSATTIELENKEELTSENMRIDAEIANSQKTESRAVDIGKKTRETIAYDNTVHDIDTKAVHQKMESDTGKHNKIETISKPVINKPAITKPEPQKKIKPEIMFWLIGTIMVAILTLIVCSGMYSIFVSPKPTQTPSTIPVSPISTATISVVFTPLAPQISEIDGTVLINIPSGEFIMGSNGANGDEPEHKVYLDSYWIDKTEVTNAKYKICVNSGECQTPHGEEYISDFLGFDLISYYMDESYADYPVVGVSWLDAKSYCEWADRRLPTEAEWEKAARGINSNTFPWGEDMVSCEYANYNECDGFPIKVDSFLSSASPYGVLNMAGNVWEWVNDWYDSNYYNESPYQNPSGPISGEQRVLRGGSWSYFVEGLATTYRLSNVSEFVSSDIGIRCATSLP